MWTNLLWKGGECFLVGLIGFWDTVHFFLVGEKVCRFDRVFNDVYFPVQIHFYANPRGWEVRKFNAVLNKNTCF